MNNTAPHLATGSELKALAKDTLRLYSMLYCPFAQRTRMVLVHKDISVEVVNVDLKKKPDWFVARNPFGLVPILEKNDQVVYESAICNEYLDEVYPQKKLLPTDPYLKARQRMLIETFSKFTVAFYKILKVAGNEQKEILDSMFSNLQRYEDTLEGKYFGGEDLSMLDIHMWPFFERFEAMKELTGLDLLPEDRFPKLTSWKTTMTSVPAVKATWNESRKHAQLARNYAAGNAKYDDLFG